MKKLVLIGSGKMAVDCLKIMTETPHDVLSIAITEPRAVSAGNPLPLYCREQGVPCLETEWINSSGVVDRLSTIGPDIMFNIGPLPRYGGVNAYSWAIINGEKHHGVTWHYLDQGIDTGDIIAQRLFE